MNHRTETVDTSLHRRFLIAGLGTGVVSALAGCSSVFRSGSEPQPGVSALTVRNRDDATHTVSIQLLQRDQTLLDEEYTLSPNREDGYQRLVTENPPLGRGTVSVRSTVEATNRQRTVEFEGDVCYRIAVTVVNGDINVLSGESNVEGACASETTQTN